VHDDDRTVEVGLANPVNAVLGATRMHTYTIENTVPMPAVAFSIPSQSHKENEGTLPVRVQLSSPSGKDVTVPFTISGTAKAWKNYKIITPGPLVIKAGDVYSEIFIVVMNNPEQEGDRTLIITLEAPLHAALEVSSVHTITIMDTDPRHRMMVVPFFNASGRKNAGDIMTLHFVSHLVHWGIFDVVEPGLARKAFLNRRLIMSEGISATDTDFISRSMDADLILTGKVLDYQDPEDATDVPKIDFIASIIERKSKKVIWSARSSKEGDEGVVFFDVGRRHTASKMMNDLNGALKEFLAP
jgi:hypothetical protein